MRRTFAAAFVMLGARLALTELIQGMAQQQKPVVSTRGQGLYEFINEANAFVTAPMSISGYHRLVQHTSCSLLIRRMPTLT